MALAVAATNHGHCGGLLDDIDCTPARPVEHVGDQAFDGVKESVFGELRPCQVSGVPLPDWGPALLVDSYCQAGLARLCPVCLPLYTNIASLLSSARAEL